MEEQNTLYLPPFYHFGDKRFNPNKLQEGRIHIYVIKSTLQAAFKIGSSKNVMNRLRVLQQGNPYTLELEGYYANLTEDHLELLENKLEDYKLLSGWYNIKALDIL